jgi:peptidoglycan/xylan/chitin deacetylase (PgdA/CDA1 family)
MNIYHWERAINVKEMKRIAIVLVIGSLLIFLGVLYKLRTDTQLVIPILAYHRINYEKNDMTVQPREFEAQLQYLQREGYTSVTLDEVIDYMQGRRTLPAKPIVFTFDDGYQDNYDIAVPLLRKYGFKAIIFVITDNIGKPGYLTWQQMKAVQERAISIGSHTLSHVDLTQLAAEEASQEARRSKQWLETGLGTPTEFFAYPYGRHNQQVIAALKSAGYKGACGTAVGVNRQGGDIYALKRIYVGQPYFGIWELELRLLRARIFS